MTQRRVREESGDQQDPTKAPVQRRSVAAQSHPASIDDFGISLAMGAHQRSQLSTAVQMIRTATADDSGIHALADAGTRDGGGRLPHLDAIQASFGRHDVSHVKAHVGGAAAAANTAMGATAYAKGDQVAFKSGPDLHTAAHEAAHVVQQRGGVSLKAGVGAPGDAYERQADAVADAVVRGESAESLLDGGAASSGGTSASAVQFSGYVVPAGEIRSHLRGPLETGQAAPEMLVAGPDGGLPLVLLDTGEMVRFWFFPAGPDPVLGAAPAAPPTTPTTGTSQQGDPSVEEQASAAGMIPGSCYRPGDDEAQNDAQCRAAEGTLDEPPQLAEGEYDRVLVAGGWHGNEPAGWEAADALIANLQADAANAPDQRQYRAHTLVIRAVNPTGIAVGDRETTTRPLACDESGRTRDEVDLNRAFHSAARSGSDRQEEPEILGVRNATAALDPHRVLNLHAIRNEGGDSNGNGVQDNGEDVDGDPNTRDMVGVYADPNWDLRSILILQEMVNQLPDELTTGNRLSLDPSMEHAYDAIEGIPPTRALVCFWEWFDLVYGGAQPQAPNRTAENVQQERDWLAEADRWQQAVAANPELRTLNPTYARDPFGELPYSSSSAERASSGRYSPAQTEEEVANIASGEDGIEDAYQGEPNPDALVRWADWISGRSPDPVPLHDLFPWLAEGSQEPPRPVITIEVGKEMWDRGQGLGPQGTHQYMADLQNAIRAFINHRRTARRP